MLRDLAWQALDDLTRAQLALFQTMGDELSLPPDERGRVLDLDDPTWAEWMQFLTDGPLPSAPTVPEMLRRLGETSFTLSTVANRNT